jgi:hypothetical protein
MSAIMAERDGDCGGKASLELRAKAAMPGDGADQAVVRW